MWVLTADSYVDTLVNNGTIYLNGHTLTTGTSSGSGTISEEAASIGGVTVATRTAADVHTTGGQLLKRQAANPAGGLSQGIYIIGGKKVWVK